MTQRDEREMKALITLLRDCDDIYDTNPGKGKVSQLDHCLQTADRAYNAGAGDQVVFVCLVHDCAKPLSEIYHGEIIAEAVRERVSEYSYNVLRTHGEFQSDIDAAVVKYGKEEWLSEALHLYHWDLASFDGHYDTSTLSAYMPIIRKAYEGELR